jgi:hypothetical protein
MDGRRVGCGVDLSPGASSGSCLGGLVVGRAGFALGVGVMALDSGASVASGTLRGSTPRSALPVASGGDNLPFALDTSTAPSL